MTNDQRLEPGDESFAGGSVILTQPIAVIDLAPSDAAQRFN
jgi:hypothetical protein